MGQVRALFPPQAPMPFTREVIEEIDDFQMGCYGLQKDKAVVYIGGGDIRAGMLGHLDGDNEAITREAPTHWIGIVSVHWEALLSEFIAEYDPVCNRDPSA